MFEVLLLRFGIGLHLTHISPDDMALGSEVLFHHHFNTCISVCNVDLLRIEI